MKYSGIACTLTTFFGIAAAPPLYHYVQGNLTPQPAPAGTITDSIVVFTGAADRVNTGYQMLRAGSGNTLMITGYDYFRHLSDETLDTLSKARVAKEIYIDDLAGSTIENARNTAQWALENEVKSILLITSDTHMNRAHFELHRLLPETIDLLTHAVPAKYRNGALDNENTRLLCRIYETFLDGSFCYQTRELARKWTFSLS